MTLVTVKCGRARRVIFHPNPFTTDTKTFAGIVSPKSPVKHAGRATFPEWGIIATTAVTISSGGIFKRAISPITSFQSSFKNIHGGCMLYCDRCGKEREYPIQEDKTKKGSCEICHAIAGPMNYTPDEELPISDIVPYAVDMAGFEIQEVKGFPVRPPRTDFINPGNPHTRFSGGIVFIMKDCIQVAIPETGKRIQIRIKH